MHRPARHPRRPSRSPIGGAGQVRLAASIAAFLLVLGAVVPAWASSGPTKLFDPAVSPRSGTPTTSVVVTVSYRNRQGSPADWVRVKVAGTTHAMTRVSGDDWKRGVTFKWSGKLPVGTHSVALSALSRDRFADALTAGSVTIERPATPAPTPRATPKPTPKPTARTTPAPAPERTPRPTPSPAPVAPTTTPVDPTATPTTSPTGTPTPSPSPDATATTSPTPSDDDIAVVPGGVIDPGTGGPSAPGAGNGGGAGGAPDQGSGAGTWAALATGLELLTSGRPTVPLGLVASLVTTSGVVGATLAFGLFGKRRRDGDPPAPDDVLAHAAASPLAVAAAAGYAGRASDLDRGDPIGVPVNVPNPLDAELALPRWRRPSLLEARKADPIRDATEAPRLTFDHGLVGPIDGRERRLIRYNLVRLLDIPDELRGRELAFLDQGDEVQLLEKRGAYWMVLCPDGLQGWIHKMTLGDAIGDPPVQSTPTATMPIAADTWTMGDDVDGDVLAAYLESRRRA
jgi:hypothetical protein